MMPFQLCWLTWFAALYLGCTFKVVIVVQATNGLTVKDRETLEINTESLSTHGSASYKFGMSDRPCNANYSGASDVAVLSISDNILFEKGANINIVGNRSLVIESVEGNIEINADIELKCNRSSGKERCLGAYLKAKCPNDIGVGTGPQWKRDKVKTCEQIEKDIRECLPGACHGGLGGMYARFKGLASFYGTDDIVCMSGGGSGLHKSPNGCVGGGAIEINARKGKVIIGGMISASAFVFDSSKTFTGCSGGLIRLIAANEVEIKSGASLKVDGTNGSSAGYFVKNIGGRRGNGGGAGGVVQIIAPKGTIRNISLEAGKKYGCANSENAENGVLLIKRNSSDTNDTYRNNTDFLPQFAWGAANTYTKPTSQNQSSPNLFSVLQQLDLIKIKIKSEKRITDDTYGELLASLNRLLNMSRDPLTKQEIMQYLGVFENCTEVISLLSNQEPLQKTQDIFHIFIKIAANVIGHDNLITWKETKKMPLFFNTLERMALSVSNSTNSTLFQSSTQNIDVQIHQFTTWENEGYRFPKHEENYIYIPKTALPKTRDFENEGYKIVVILLKDIQSGLPDSFPQSHGESKNSSFRVASLLMSCSIIGNGAPITELLSPATLNFLVQKQNMKKNEKAQCAFWNIKDNSWDREGVSVKSFDSSQTVCTTTHFTNFAVLMQHTPIQLTEGEKLSMSLITYIGCGISIAALLIAMIVFIRMEALSSDRHRIHLNLIIALLLAQILFLSGLKATEHKTLCKVIAGVLHYLYMVSFMWMLIEGVHLYLKVVKVFGIEHIKIRQYCLIGWGLPALIVGIAAIIKPYGYGTKYVCWLSLDNSLIWAFLGPVIFIITINIFILAAVIKTVVQSAATMRSSDHSHIKAGIKGALVLMPLMGITWVFGLLAVNRETLMFQYIFSISNSLQGFFILLLYVVFNNEMRMAFKRHLEKKKLSKGSGDYNNSISHSNESGNKLKTLGKSSSNGSVSGLSKLKDRLSMSLMPRTSRVVAVQPINKDDEDDGVQVIRQQHQPSTSTKSSGLNSPSGIDSHSKAPLHRSMRKAGKKESSAL